MAISHTYITEDGQKTNGNFTRGKAIRQKCLDCTVWQPREIRLCTAIDCALFPYRMGRVTRTMEVEKLTPIGELL